MDNPLVLQLVAFIDPYGISFHGKLFIGYDRSFAAYFDRYANTKIFQIQAAGDQFFLLDSEVNIKLEIDI